MPTLNDIRLREILGELSQPAVNIDEVECFRDLYVSGSVTQNNHQRLTHLVKVVNQMLEQLERKKVKIFDAGRPELDGQAASYRARFQPYFQAAPYVKARLDQMRQVDPKLEEAHQLLCRQEVGLRYRIGASNGGLDPLAAPDPDCLAKLEDYAREWKRGQKLAVNREINELEHAQLQEAARYPEWVALLEEDKAYCKEFMGWAIQHYNPPAVFIQYEALRKKIKASLISSALGYSRNLDNEILSIQTAASRVDGIAKKALTFLLYQANDFKEFDPAKQERVSILKPESEIHFESGNYHLSVKEFFDKWALKDQREVELSLSAWGFINYHPVHGPWNADAQMFDEAPLTTLNREDWYEHVPPARIVTQEELERVYGDEVRGKNVFFKVMAARKNLDLTALDCHAFWQIYVSMGNGQWKVINPGVYAYRFAQGVWDGIKLFCATVKRVLCLMDQNSYYTHRIRAAYPVFPTAAESGHLLDRIYDVLTSQAVFQFSGRNCAYCVQKNTQRAINNMPNFYRMPIVNVKTGIGPLDNLLGWASKKSEWIQHLIVGTLQRMLGSARGLYIPRAVADDQGIRQEETWQSVNEFLGRKGDFIHNPAFLVHQITEAKRTGEGPFANGELFWTHTDERLLTRNEPTPNLGEHYLAAFEMPEAAKTTLDLQQPVNPDLIFVGG
ncbi:Conserved hypothetical protein [Candidatus Protochlamydia naegleriophila]|uniref:Uncharacterized protein n=1 Tax=Candidatus Protochlamydia naegleriophila TaxID=389348 RepID=A0A0U5JBA6_9BACT|nr:hypothetical protein [Candidatus Protochlamydia naegleriophila]CUI17128.1 Conserved hypothetical protein [Candidatus Protochlamydia naegleriophila]